MICKATFFVKFFRISETFRRIYNPEGYSSLHTASWATLTTCRTTPQHLNTWNLQLLQQWAKLCYSLLILITAKGTSIPLPTFYNGDNNGLTENLSEAEFTPSIKQVCTRIKTPFKDSPGIYHHLVLTTTTSWSLTPWPDLEIGRIIPPFLLWAR